MTQPLELILPMGGAGTRFFDNGFDCPKPLIELHGKPFFYWATESLYGQIPTAGLTFVILHEHAQRFGLRDRILEYYPNARIVELPQVLRGAVLTCLEGVQGLPEDRPVLFNDCDHFFRCTALAEFCRSEEKADGLLLTFQSQEPCYSYLDCDENGWVKRTVEKQVISNHAICGAYYFARKDLFCDYARRYLETCTYREFFLSGVYNTMADDGRLIRGLPVDFHVPFGTPDEYRQALSQPELFAL